MKAEQAKTAKAAIFLLDKKEWERFIDLQSGFDENGNDGNGLGIEDIKGIKSSFDTPFSNRIEILKYLGWY